MELKNLSNKDLIELKKSIELEIKKRSGLKRNIDKKKNDNILTKTNDKLAKRNNKTKTYVNPENPWETWSGRGRKPNWVNAAIKAGMKLSDLEIK